MNDCEDMIRMAAILQDGKIWIGKRHGDIISDIVRATGVTLVKGTQGFVTMGGKFVNRHEAYDLAMKYNQIIDLSQSHKGTLYSEDLY